MGPEIPIDGLHAVFFRDPDGLEGEVCVENPDAVPGTFHPPGDGCAEYLVFGF